MDKTTADKLLNQTRKNYDNFAQTFARTRDYVPNQVESLLAKYIQKNDKVLDIGCGNGRFYPLFTQEDADYYGIDNSKNLIIIAKNNFPEANFVVADALNLPFRENMFDMTVTLAVIHHIPSQTYRQKFFQEAWRILKPGGIFIAMVWNLRPLTMAKIGQWKRLRGFLKSQIKIALGLENLDFGDFFIPWQNKYQRYVHSFTLDELKKLACGTGFKILEAGVMPLGKKESNLYIVTKK